MIEKYNKSNVELLEILTKNYKCINNLFVFKCTLKYLIKYFSMKT